MVEVTVTVVDFEIPESVATRVTTELDVRPDTAVIGKVVEVAPC